MHKFSLSFLRFVANITTFSIITKSVLFFERNYFVAQDIIITNQRKVFKRRVIEFYFIQTEFMKLNGKQFFF